MVVDEQIDVIAQRLANAKQPEEVFGYVDWDAAERAYHRIAKTLHPDRHPGASDVMKALNVWWARAKARREAGVWGEVGKSLDKVTIGSKHAVYTVDATPWRSGDVADLFKTDDGLVLKIARDPRDTDLMRAEAETLRRIHTNTDLADLPGGHDQYRVFAPKLVESFDMTAGGARRAVNVLQFAAPNLYSVEDVLARQGPLDAKHMAWIWRRSLKLLGYLDLLGIVHAAVTPAHILINEDHAMMLADWCYATPRGQQLKAIPEAYKAWYPTQYFHKAPAARSLDVLLGVKSMVVLMGGDARTGLLPSDVPSQIRRHFEFFWRYPDLTTPGAWGLNREFTELIEQVWGKRTYHHLVIAST